MVRYCAVLNLKKTPKTNKKTPTKTNHVTKGLIRVPEVAAGTCVSWKVIQVQHHSEVDFHSLNSIQLHDRFITWFCVISRETGYFNLSTASTAHHCSLMDCSSGPTHYHWPQWRPLLHYLLTAMGVKVEIFSCFLCGVRAPSWWPRVVITTHPKQTTGWVNRTDRISVILSP